MAETSSAPHSTLTLKQRLVRCVVGLVVVGALVLYAGFHSQQGKQAQTAESHQH